MGPGRGTESYIGDTWTPLKAIKSIYGYAVIGFHGRKQVRLGRLILEAFVGPCPEGMQCCHDNGDRMDSRLCNLRWGTPKSNAADRDRHGTTAHGERIASSRFTERDIREMHRLLSEGVPQTVIAARFSTSNTVIWNIVHGRSWKRIYNELKGVPDAGRVNDD